LPFHLARLWLIREPVTNAPLVDLDEDKGLCCIASLTGNLRHLIANAPATLRAFLVKRSSHANSWLNMSRAAASSGGNHGRWRRRDQGRSGRSLGGLDVINGSITAHSLSLGFRTELSTDQMKTPLLTAESIEISIPQPPHAEPDPAHPGALHEVSTPPKLVNLMDYIHSLEKRIKDLEAHFPAQPSGIRLP
jgi:hypothetical protein